MKTNTLSFRDLLQQDIRLLVPLYQRPYVWNEKDQWEPFWEDLRAIAEDLFHDRFRRPHFLGAIVLEQVLTGTGEIQKRLVIDGQQRLTTSQIVLEAFHDLCHEFGADKPRQALAKMIRNDDPMTDGPDEIFKVWPTTVDQEAFRPRSGHGRKPFSKPRGKSGRIRRVDWIAPPLNAVNRPI